jgi:hypothetical protein
MIGPRQRRVLDLLADGPYSLGALIARIGGRPELASQSIMGLQRAGLVVVTDRRHARRQAGAMVALADPAGSNSSVAPPTRRAAGAELVGIADRLRGLTG